MFACAGKADDVQVVALDALDEPATKALDRVRAGPPLPLAARDVRGDRLGILYLTTCVGLGYGP